MRILAYDYCTMANFSMSFIFPFFSGMLSNGDKQQKNMSGLNKHGEIFFQEQMNKYVFNVKWPYPYPLLFTLWYTKVKNLRKTGKCEKEKNICHLFGNIRNGNTQK